MRLPAVAGQFYPGNAAELKHQLEDMLPQAEEIPVFGGSSPACRIYLFRASVAAEVYSRLPKRETYVILGPNHHGLGSPVALSRDSWRTPLGVVQPDLELAEALAGTIIDQDEVAHLQEHSIEVQIPFLQTRFQDFKILPISMGMQDEETAVEVGEELARPFAS